MKKLNKILMWIVFFPLMLTYSGWKTIKKPVRAIGAILTLLFLVIGCDGQQSRDNISIEDNQVLEQNIDKDKGISTQPNNNDYEETTVSENKENADLFEGYTLIEVDGGNLSGSRQANVVVDIGFGDREYYAFANEHGQLVKVVAAEIVLQDENTESVTSKGRYYPDEAKVPGVESSTLDEGHVIG